MIFAGIAVPHPVLVLFDKLGSGICFTGSAGDCVAGVGGVDGLVAGAAGFVWACAIPAVPSAANSATAYSVRFIESSYSVTCHHAIAAQVRVHFMARCGKVSFWTRALKLVWSRCRTLRGIPSSDG
jgi:hypothetical protein